MAGLLTHARKNDVYGPAFLSADRRAAIRRGLVPSTHVLRTPVGSELIDGLFDETPHASGVPGHYDLMASKNSDVALVYRPVPGAGGDGEWCHVSHIDFLLTTGHRAKQLAQLRLHDSNGELLGIVRLEFARNGRGDGT